MIVEGRRVPGLEAVKYKGRKEWAIIDLRTGDGYALPVSVDTDTPIEERFYYCSIVSQPVFVTYYVGPMRTDDTTPSSWKKMPQGWRDIFLRDLGELLGTEKTA